MKPYKFENQLISIFSTIKTFVGFKFPWTFEGEFKCRAAKPFTIWNNIICIKSYLS